VRAGIAQGVNIDGFNLGYLMMNTFSIRRAIHIPTRWLQALFCSCLLLVVTGCVLEPLSDRQVVELRRAGFHRADGGWGFDLDGRILFDSDESTLTRENRATIARIVRVLRDLRIRRIYVEGYADSSGREDYNEDLSVRRAEAVAREIERRGWPSYAIEVRGYGANYPVANNATSRGRAQNRRVVIVVPD
jgi:outer membrane protein OmpA-like peptidoglycan-associated protein